MSQRAPLRFAVFGSPVAHSLSPRIHTAFAAQFGIALEYRAIEVSASEFPAVLSRFHAEGGAGANVTLPLKELAAEQVQAMDRAAQRAGAVNTLIRTDAGWAGANTDGLGFLADLQRAGVHVAGASVVILGAGGAVRGIVGPLLDAGAGSIRVLNRSVARARMLVADVGDARLTVLEGDELGHAGAPDLLVNAISAGHSGAVLDWPERLCGPHTATYDLSYGTAARAFLAWSRARGARLAMDGLGMLVGQAAEAFALWHGMRPAIESVLADLRVLTSVER
jgi:shikimate dehydrogenase